MNIEDRFADLNRRIYRIEQELALPKIYPIPSPAPHPLAGVGHESEEMGTYWWSRCCSRPASQWWDYRAYNFPDSTTHAHIPLWEIARRLGI